MVKLFKGVVARTKMTKTAVVVVERQKAHKLYGKVMRIKRSYHVHDDLGTKVGDRVVIMETRPISKTKKWKLVEVVGQKNRVDKVDNKGREGKKKKGKKK